MSHTVIIRDAIKRYGDFQALNGVNLTIQPGEFFTLLGPSGCGKTTLLRMIAGFNPVDGGEILFDDKVINDLPAHKRDIGMVFQNYAIFPHLTVEENVAYGLKAKKVPKDEIQRRVKDALELVQIENLATRKPNELSGGQQQRVALARAFVIEPALLLMDEPLSNLDAKLRVQMRTIIKKLQRKLGITTIYVTHDQDEALSMSDIIAVMRKGRIEQVGSPWEIYFRPANRFVADFVGTVNFLVGRTRRTEDGLSVEHAGMCLRVEDAPVQDGEQVTLVVRPECIRLLRPGETAPDGTTLSGTIENYSFLGRMIRYWVRVGEEVFIIDDANVDLTGARSGQVQLCLDTHKLHILKDGGMDAAG